MSNSFGFGGSNCVLLFGGAQAARAAMIAMSTPLHTVISRASVSGRRACRVGITRARSCAAKPPAPATPQTRPAPALLPPAERRRAPDTVAVSLEVATRACEMAQRDPKLMPSVFASHARRSRDQRCHLRHAGQERRCSRRRRSSTTPCTTLRPVTGRSPPAASKPYTSLSGYTFTFGEGLLEAASQAIERKHAGAVRRVRHRSARPGRNDAAEPRCVRRRAGDFAGAERSAARQADVRVDLASSHRGDAKAGRYARAENAALVEGNAMANGLPLFEALADGVERHIVQSLAPQLGLHLRVTPASVARDTSRHHIQRA